MKADIDPTVRFRLQAVYSKSGAACESYVRNAVSHRNAHHGKIQWMSAHGEHFLEHAFIGNRKIKREGGGFYVQQLYNGRRKAMKSDRRCRSYRKELC
jgi:hypothetical protein